MLLELRRLISLSTFLFREIMLPLYRKEIPLLRTLSDSRNERIRVESKSCPPLTGIRRPSFASDAVNRTDGTVSIVNRSGLHQTLYVTSIGLCRRSYIVSSSRSIRIRTTSLFVKLSKFRTHRPIPEVEPGQDF